MRRRSSSRGSTSSARASRWKVIVDKLVRGRRGEGAHRGAGGMDERADRRPPRRGAGGNAGFHPGAADRHPPPRAGYGVPGPRWRATSIPPPTSSPGHAAGGRSARWWAATSAAWTPAMRAQLPRRGMSEREVVTLASIVEREAKDWRERPTIAAVYRNRMRKGHAPAGGSHRAVRARAAARAAPLPRHRVGGAGPVQHLHARRPPSRPHRLAQPGRHPGRAAARERRLSSTSSRAPTAPTSSRARWPSTMPPSAPHRAETRARGSRARPGGERDFGSSAPRRRHRPGAAARGATSWTSCARRCAAGAPASSSAAKDQPAREQVALARALLAERARRARCSA